MISACVVAPLSFYESQDFLLISENVDIGKHTCTGLYDSKYDWKWLKIDRNIILMALPVDFSSCIIEIDKIVFTWWGSKRL